VCQTKVGGGTLNSGVKFELVTGVLDIYPDGGTINSGVNVELVYQCVRQK